MLGYAILAIELSDLDAAAQLLAIIEPYAGEIATSLGPVAAYAGRLASLLGHHELAERHLSSALEIVEAFDWDYHRASVVIWLKSESGKRLSDRTASRPAPSATRADPIVSG
jgi:hypothetical protein